MGYAVVRTRVSPEVSAFMQKCGLTECRQCVVTRRLESVRFWSETVFDPKRSNQHGFGSFTPARTHPFAYIFIVR